MTETVHDITSVAVKTSTLKKWSKRVAIVTVVTAVAAAIYSKVNDTDEDAVNPENTEA